MHGTILVYGNEPVLVTTRGLILEKAGYKVFTAQAFGNAMLVLMHHQIDACVLCQSLTDEERQGILETARTLQPEIKCAVLDFAESEVAIEGVDLIRGLVGPSTMLTQKGPAQTM
jgi:DNA-binding response OmpR family regulator